MQPTHLAAIPPRFTVGLLLVFAPLALPHRAAACMLCIRFPDQTDVDVLISGQCVVLARPTAEKPFTYSVVETLKGEFDGREINLLVDSMARRRLAAEPRLSALLVQRKQGGQWRRLGIVNQAYLFMVRRILLVADQWNGPEGKERRWKFFLPLFGNADSRIRQLAYLELGRAPYAALRQLGRSVPRETYAGMLTDPKYLEWKSLAILLLAQSSAPQDRQLIKDSLAASERLAITTNLSAWVAAAIEIDPEGTLQFIADKYARTPKRTAEEIDEVLKALSMHGSNADDKLQRQIVVSYGLILTMRPELAARVADDLVRWQRFELVNQLAGIQENFKALPTQQRRSISRYLEAAAEKKESALGPR